MKQTDATTLSTMEAAKVIGCSINHVIRCFRRGELSGSYKPWPKRLCLRVTKRSVAYYKVKAMEDKRIGRIVPHKERAVTLSKGYVMHHRPEHPRANSGGYVPEHYLVMEAHLGRHLRPEEVVYHNNKDRADNRLENLTLHTSRSVGQKTRYAEILRLVYSLANDEERDLGIAKLTEIARNHAKPSTVKGD